MFYKETHPNDEIILNTLSELVPKDHLLRKIDKSIDFNFIYEITSPYYSHTNGRNSLDPVVLFKLVFLKDIYGIKSMRETIKRVETDVAFRWFLNLPFSKPTPHYSTFSQNYIRRFQGTSVFEDIFNTIVHQAISHHLISGTALFTDSTHIKANANKNKFRNAVIEVVQERKRDLENEINAEREAIGKKPFSYTDKIISKNIKESTTDKESGYYHRDNKEKGFMYLDHRSVDGKHNFIVDCFITPGNVHDSVPYVSRLTHIIETFHFNVNCVALDSGYYKKDILKFLEEQKIFSVIGYRRFHRNPDHKFFRYDSSRDCFTDTRTGEIYTYRNIDRQGYKQYRISDNSNKRILRRAIDADVYDRCRERRLSTFGKALYKRRKETIERSFADSKQNHGYRFAQYRGVAKMQQYTWLSCAAQNMKKMAILLTRDSHFLQYSSLFIIFKCKIQRIFQNWRNTLDFLSLLSTV
ncbi:IS1182 family transposase [Carnobacteriaceae bacterium zg-84]|nr:IS1182 family transposase [Carnobacteriaceae bacterium zg-84]